MVRSFELFFDKQTGPSIELGVNNDVLDLHNFANFDRIEYEVEAGIYLTWKPSRHNQFCFEGNAIKNATLFFTGKTQFNVVGTDSEDGRDLEHFEFEPLPDGRIDAKFYFFSEMKITIRADKVFAIIEQ